MTRANGHLITYPERTGSATEAAVVGRARHGAGSTVQRGSMSVEVADHIRSMIFDGRLRAGQRVPQDAIAAELGVSRLPVREALITLEADGLVAAEPHRGVFVVPIRAEDIEDHYRLYGMAQGLAGSGRL